MIFDLGTLRGIATLVLLIAFIGICIWAYSPGRKKNFEQASRLPFADLENNDAMSAIDHHGKQQTHTEIKNCKASQNATLKSENSINE